MHDEPWDNIEFLKSARKEPTENSCANCTFFSNEIDGDRDKGHKGICRRHRTKDGHYFTNTEQWCGDWNLADRYTQNQVRIQLARFVDRMWILASGYYENLDAETVGDIADSNPFALLKTKGMGPSRLEYVFRMLQTCGIPKNSPDLFWTRAITESKKTSKRKTNRNNKKPKRPH